MPNANISEAPRIYPTLRCKDADAMISWLKEAFGLTERVIYRHAGSVAHAELMLGSSIIMLGQSRDDDYGKLVGSLDGRRTNALYVAVGDPDAMYDRAKAAGALIEKDPYDTDYGSRDFASRDPEGNLWTFGSYWPKSNEAPM